MGVGAMGRRHVRVLSEMPDRYELMGVFDADRGVAEEVSRAWRVPVLRDTFACVEAAEIVVIASPIGAHAAGAKCALERGCHVLVEKPLCASVLEATVLVRIAARNSTLLFVGHSERFNPVIVALRQLVQAHEIRTICIRRATPAHPAATLAEGRIREEGVLLSLGVHDVDLVSHLTDSSVTLRDVSGVPTGNEEDRAALTLVAASGALARVIADRVAPCRERTIELSTRDEVFEGNLLVPRLVRRPRGARGPRTPVDLPSIEPLVEQARAVALALDGRGSRRVATGVDGASALAVALDARQRLQAVSAQRGVSEAS
jgi:UDP-N-acetylglucosamine 3-dehydrogenase